MSKVLVPELTVHLLHHTGTETAGSMVRYSYAGQDPIVLRRPRDGASPDAIVLRCANCDERLTYRVFSVQAARRARWIWSVLGVAGIGLVALVVLAAPNGVVAIVGGLAGVGLAGGSFVVVSRDLGVAGPGRLWPRPHHLSLPPEERPEKDLPSVRCERCGHREHFTVGGFHDAKARLAHHTCKADKA